MKILAFDTSTMSGSVALLDGAHLLAEWTFLSSQSHNRRLLKVVDRILGEAGWQLQDVNAIATTLGPGSFTGVRIGLTTAKTLSWALGRPFLGIPSLDALAAPLAFASLPVCALIDARKSEVYQAVYQPDGRGSLRRLAPYRVIPPDLVPQYTHGPTIFCGDGWLLYRDRLRQVLGDQALDAPAPCHVLRAGFVAELARQRLLAGESDDPVSGVPLYIRPSEAEIHYPHLSKHLETEAPPEGTDSGEGLSAA